MIRQQFSNDTTTPIPVHLNDIATTNETQMRRFQADDRPKKPNMAKY
jgi:hypothetical protein